jgi:hypothetical protein
MWHAGGQEKRLEHSHSWAWQQVPTSNVPRTTRPRDFCSYQFGELKTSGSSLIVALPAEAIRYWKVHVMQILLDIVDDDYVEVSTNEDKNEALNQMLADLGICEL